MASLQEIRDIIDGEATEHELIEYLEETNKTFYEDFPVQSNPLFFAVKNKLLRLVSYLFNTGVKFDYQKYNVLHYIFETNPILDNKLVKVTEIIKSHFRLHRQHKQLTLLQKAAEKYKEYNEDSIKLFELLLEDHPSNLYIKYDPMYYALQSNNVALFRFLLNKNPSSLYNWYNFRQEPLLGFISNSKIDSNSVNILDYCYKKIS